MSLPNASQGQINAMLKEAEKKMAQDGIVIEEVVPGQTNILNPTLQHHEEPQQEEYVAPQEYEVEQNEEDLPVKPETVKEFNLRELRQAKERAERERDEMMKQILSFQQQKQNPIAQDDVEEDEFADMGIEDESLVEGKHLKQMVREIKNLKQTVKQYEKQTRQSSQETMDVRLKSQYPDINKVLTKENIELFRDMNPDLADTINHNPDMFKKASLAYQMIKQYGIYKEDNFASERAVAQKNAAKPRPLAAVSPQQGESPMSKANAFANGLTTDLKAQLHKEMLAAMKGN
jgi:hypothetical protein